MTLADSSKPEIALPAGLHEVVERLTARRHRSVDVWQRSYLRRLVLGDLVIVVAALSIALKVRFGDGGSQPIGTFTYASLSMALVPIWLAVLGLGRAYQIRVLGTGPEEFKRVATSSLQLLAAVAVVSYVFHLDVARGYVAVAFPVGTGLLLLGRYGQRRLLHHNRHHGKYVHRVLAVGSPERINALSRQLSREIYAGLSVVGACVPDPANRENQSDVAVVGSLTDVLDGVTACDADTVAICGGPGMSPDLLRTLSWDLQGTGIDLVVAPALVDVAGPRVSIRPVAGLPLLQIDEPELSGMRQFVKASVEWFFALLAFIFVAPIIAVCAVAVRLDSHGAPLFRQTRIGRHGKPFTVYKLRTMRADAEVLLDTLREQNERADGLLFKMREDPRITRVGSWLRKWSLDELPQLWNVVKGDMALVGPRPPLPGEVAQYGDDVARRLLVRPGITGLWQVSGRSNLSWEDSVRLDLYYVENWSLTLDALIVWKTFFAIIRREGAY